MLPALAHLQRRELLLALRVEGGHALREVAGPRALVLPRLGGLRTRGRSRRGGLACTRQSSCCKHVPHWTAAGSDLCVQPSIDHGSCRGLTCTTSVCTLRRPSRTSPTMPLMAASCAWEARALVSLGFEAVGRQAHLSVMEVGKHASRLATRPLFSCTPACWPRGARPTAAPPSRARWGPPQSAGPQQSAAGCGSKGGEQHVSTTATAHSGREGAPGSGCRATSVRFQHWMFSPHQRTWSCGPCP